MHQAMLDEQLASGRVVGIDHGGLIVAALSMLEKVETDSASFPHAAAAHAINMRTGIECLPRYRLFDMWFLCEQERIQ